MLIVAVLASMQLRRPDVFPVTEVQLQGVFEHVADQRVAQATLPNIHGNFFTVDVDAVHAQVSTIPWVAVVWVDRIWPNILRVRVQEEQPFATWNDQGLINRDAKLFVNGELENAALHFYGPQGEQARVAQQYDKLNDVLKRFGLALASLRVDERLSWQATLENGLILQLGRRDVVERIGRFVKVYQGYLQNDQNKIESVDLRYPNGFALRWKAEGEAGKK
ncbi:MAG: cell division protein FtsQ/DivIB [Gammaproteobacteria bacterium]|nr:cell division protein FtsQ/DivIB [Gammaproteobacteria bacterium]